MPDLRILELRGNTQLCSCPEAARNLAVALSNVPKLEVLDLAQVGLVSEGMSELAPILGQLQKLRKLDLGGNMLREGAYALAASLKSLPQVGSLGLRVTG